MRAKISKRLKDRRGFSLTELLATLVILLMVAMVMAEGVPSAVRAYVSVVDKANAQVLLSTTMTALRDELGMATKSDTAGETADGKATRVIYTDGAGIRNKIYSDAAGKLNDDTNLDNFGIHIYEYMDYFGPDESTRLLVRRATETEHLTVTFDGVTQVKSGGVVVLKFENLKVWKNGTELAKAETFEVRTMEAA